MFVNLRKDSAINRPALVDYVMMFVKPGANATPINGVDRGEVTNEDWIRWARGVWHSDRDDALASERAALLMAQIQAGTIAPKPRAYIDEMTNDEVAAWAQSVWYGIKETNTLNAALAREDSDERHLCPLQLDLIERCVKLWSNPGETVFSPFTGIGSEGYVALTFRRKFVGTELKQAYYDRAVINLKTAISNREAAGSQGDLFGGFVRQTFQVNGKASDE